jgi:hypothetical protein
MTQKKLLLLSASAIMAIMTKISPAVAIPVSVSAPFFYQSAYSAVPIDNRLYRHCHNVGKFVRCYTADPWSPEHMKLDRLQGRLHHEGGPEDSMVKHPYKRLQHRTNGSHPETTRRIMRLVIAINGARRVLRF